MVYIASTGIPLLFSSYSQREREEKKKKKQERTRESKEEGENVSQHVANEISATPYCEGPP